jgi:hypothetical protein
MEKRISLRWAVSKCRKAGHRRFVGYTFAGGDPMTKICAVASTLFLATTLLSQERQTDWTAASNNPDIQYRNQAFSGAKACYVDFRDQKQGKGSTTFDVEVSYNSTDLGPDGKPVKKTETEHVVTVPTHNGTSRIPSCSSVTDARVNFLLRH